MVAGVVAATAAVAAAWRGLLIAIPAWAGYLECTGAHDIPVSADRGVGHYPCESLKGSTRGEPVYDWPWQAKVRGAHARGNDLWTDYGYNALVDVTVSHLRNELPGSMPLRIQVP